MKQTVYFLLLCVAGLLFSCLEDDASKLPFTDDNSTKTWAREFDPRTERIKIKIDPNNFNRLIWEIPSSDLYPYDADIEEGECPQFLADPNFGRPMTLPYNMVLNKQ